MLRRAETMRIGRSVGWLVGSALGWPAGRGVKENRKAWKKRHGKSGCLMVGILSQY